MTKKDIRKVEEVVERVLHDMIESTYDDDGEATIPISIIDDMEDYMGEPITFMGIC